MGKQTAKILSAVLRHLKSRPRFDTVGIEQYRNFLEKSALVLKPDKSVKAEDFDINTIKAQWLTPDVCDEKRIIMFIHGGGYIAGSINSYKDLTSRIAKTCKARLAVFNYRLAPENPFPAGLEDVKTVYQYLTEKYRDSSSITIVADSAGAGLGLALLSTLLKEKSVLPACAVFISPWIDLECKNRSLMENKAKDPMLSQEILKKTARLYTDQDLSNPLISPVNNDFSGICPVLIQAGENEVLLDDSKILAQRLKRANAPVQLEIWDEMFHVWHYFARYIPQGREAINHIADFINR